MKALFVGKPKITYFMHMGLNLLFHRTKKQFSLIIILRKLPHQKNLEMGSGAKF